MGMMGPPSSLNIKVLLEKAALLTREAVGRDQDRVNDADLKALLEYIGRNIFDHNLSLRKLRRSGKFPIKAFASFRTDLFIREILRKTVRN